MHRTVQAACREPAVVLVGVSAVVPLLTPTYAASGSLLVVTLIVAAAAIALSVRAGGVTGSVRSRVWLYLGISLAAWLCVTSAFADDAWTSLLGLAGQHNGTSLWVAALAVTMASALTASKRSLRAVIVTASGGFGILALLAVLEALGAPVSPGRLWGSAAGVLENSLSAAQVFIVGGSASVAWAMFANGRSERFIAIACAALSLGGIAVTDSRAGTVGLAIGLATALVLVMNRRSGRAGGTTAALTAVAAVGTSLCLAVADGVLGSSAFDALNSVSTDRALIWRSAVARLGTSPFIGNGVEQFSAWIDWSLQPSGALSYYGAYDPHNVLLALLLGGGIVALALGIVTAMAVFSTLVRTWDTNGRPKFMLVLIAGVVALAFSTLFAWVSVPAAIGAAAIIGTLLGLDRKGGTPAERSSDDTAHRTAVTAVAVACAAFALAAAAVMPAEFRALPGADAGDLIEAALTGHDPDIGARALATTLETSGPGEEATAIVVRYAEARRWHVDLALRALAYHQMRSAVFGEDTFAAFVRTANEGLEADPASGIWYFLTALEAERLDMVPEARRYAGLALDYPIGEAERIQLQRILAP
ncbi:MAG: hypothetical protein Kow0067_14680 [Coriobacteriia bacterium]